MGADKDAFEASVAPRSGLIRGRETLELTLNLVPLKQVPVFVLI